MLWAEAVYTYERVQNSMAINNSHKFPFEILTNKSLRSLVCFQILDLLDTSLRGRNIRVKSGTKYPRRSWLDTRKIIIETRTNSKTQKQKESI